jgi:hypothetical protein
MSRFSWHNIKEKDVTLYFFCYFYIFISLFWEEGRIMPGNVEEEKELGYNTLLDE